MKKNDHNFLFNGLVASCLIFFLTFAASAQSGSPDNSFDGDGIVTTDFGSSTDDRARTIAVQSDGKIVVAGKSNSKFAIARYHPDGSLDTDFSNDGKQTTNFPGSSFDEGKSIAFQSNGRILLAGISTTGTNADFAIARYLSNGTLDNSFSSDGMATAAIGAGSDEGKSVVLQKDGKIIVAGQSFNGIDNDFAVVRFDNSGLLDPTFGTNGKVTVDFSNSNDEGNCVQLQADGKIVVVGFSTNANEDFAVIRLNVNGSLDTTFSADGKVTTSVLGDVDKGFSAAIQPDGKIVVSGLTQNGTDSDFATVRYTVNGALDTMFNKTGKVVTNINGLSNNATCVSLQNDGKIVVSGKSTFGSGTDFAVVRYHANGVIDSTFDIDGIVTTDMGSASDDAFSNAIQSDGKILVAGEVGSASNHNFAIVRYRNSTTAVDEAIFPTSAIKIYPNPNSGMLTIELKGSIIQPAELRIYNMFGRFVFSTRIRSEQTLIALDLDQGSYVYKLVDSHNQFVESGKLLIH